MLQHVRWHYQGFRTENSNLYLKVRLLSELTLFDIFDHALDLKRIFNLDTRMQVPEQQPQGKSRL